MNREAILIFTEKDYFLISDEGKCNCFEKPTFGAEFQKHEA